MDFQGAATKLTDGAVDALAKARNLDPAVIWAVCDVESGGGFLPDGRPRILFEAHVFGRLTDHEYDAAYPNISAPAWNRALYGAPGAHQYERLTAAIELDREAALEAASWGMFQIMGMNHAQCGFADAESFVTAMCDSEDAQLQAFDAFCRNGGLEGYLRRHDWEAFALHYNGPGQVEHYAAKLSEAFDNRFAASSASSASSAPQQPSTSAPRRLWIGSSGPDVVQLQKKLASRGYPNVKADGQFGPITKQALLDYEAQHHLTAGPITLDVLG
jgi:hypothetical protein